MSNIQIHQSVIGFMAEKNSKAVDYLNQKLSTKGDTGAIKIAAKFTVSALVSTVGSAFHAVFIVASLVEAVARHVLALTVKLATFIIPAGISNWIDNKVVIPLFKHGQMTLETVPRSAARIVTNFLSDETKKSADTKISFNKVYNSNLFNNFYRFHWTGLSGITPKISSDIQEKAPTPDDLKGRVSSQPEENPTDDTQVKSIEEKPAVTISKMKAIQETFKWAWNNKKEAVNAVGKALIGPTARKVYLGLGGVVLTALLVTSVYKSSFGSLIPSVASTLPNSSMPETATPLITSTLPNSSMPETTTPLVTTALPSSSVTKISAISSIPIPAEKKPIFLSVFKWFLESWIEGTMNE